MKKILKNKWIIISLILLIILLASLVTQGFGFKKLFRPSANDLAVKAIDYINANVLTGNTTATLVASQWLDNGLCKFSLSINGQKYDSYISSDGQFLFPDTFNMKEAEEQKAKKKADQEDKTRPTVQEMPKTDKPDVKLFVMAFCPYGNQAEDLMKPVNDLLGNQADINLNYVIYDHYAQRMGAKAEDYCLSTEEKYCSMHGIGELNQDVREICISKYQPDKLWNFVEKINQKTNAHNVDDKWITIARDLKIDIKKIINCQNNEAEQLLAEEKKLNEKYGVKGSPTLIINDTEYQGERSSEGYKQAICQAFVNPPQECAVSLNQNENQVKAQCK